VRSNKVALVLARAAPDTAAHAKSVQRCEYNEQLLSVQVLCNELSVAWRCSSFALGWCEHLGWNCGGWTFGGLAQRQTPAQCKNRHIAIFLLYIGGLSAIHGDRQSGLRLEIRVQAKDATETIQTPHRPLLCTLGTTIPACNHSAAVLAALGMGC
jgi:hypothetical protein